MNFCFFYLASSPTTLLQACKGMCEELNFQRLDFFFFIPYSFFSREAAEISTKIWENVTVSEPFKMLNVTQSQHKQLFWVS